MKYLVSGNKGFIGGHLMLRLISTGHDVMPFDLKDGHDIRDIDALCDRMKGMDGVLHLAALPKVPYSIEHPVETTETNILGTVNVLEAARRSGVPRVVSFSSSSTKAQPTVSPYGAQKKTGEEFCRLFSSLYGMSTVSLRPHNVYGAGMNPLGGYAPVFLIWKGQYERGEACTITGDGEQTRDFTAVSDIVEAACAAMFHGKHLAGEVFDAGSGKPITINRAKELFLEVFPGARFEYIPERMGDQKHSRADLSTADLINWRPSVDPEEGIRALFRSWA